MGVVAGLAAAASAASIANSVNSAVSGPGSTGGFSGGSSPPQAYIPTDQAGFDQYYQNIVGGLTPYTSGSSSLIPSQISQYQTYAGDITGSPYAAGALQGAQQGAAYGANTLYPMLAGGTSGLFGLSQGASPYASQILQTGFDPQNALYNKLFQQTQDQSNATNAMYGLASSPYGAGLTNQALTNFNLDWQNQQLQRQATAAQGYGSLLGSIGKGYAGASDLGAAAMNLPVTAGGLPYQTQLGIDTNALNALNTAGTGYGSALGLASNTLNPISAYLRLGQSATGLGADIAGQNFSQNQALGQSFGSALNSLGSVFGNQNQGASGGGGGGFLSGLGSLFGGGSSVAPSASDLALQYAGSYGDLGGIS